MDKICMFQQPLKLLIVFRWTLSAALISLLLTGSAHMVSAQDVNRSPIKYVFIIMQENRSFDHYFGTYPAANGLPQGVKLPVKEGNATEFVSPFHMPTPVMEEDPPHSWLAMHQAWANGTNSGFAYTMGHESMGYYDSSELPYYWVYASEFVLADNYYSSLMGPTIPNRIFALSGQSGGYYDNPTQYDFTLEIRSIFHLLEEGRISWGDYFDGVQKELRPISLAFSGITNNSASRSIVSHTDRFIADLESGNARTVSWITAFYPYDEHPPANVTQGQIWVVNMVNKIMESPYWQSSAIFITWDEGGGLYDHVPPPQVDSWGHGFRVPLLVISPYAKEGYISHLQYDHTSLLKFIEWNFGLPCITERDCQATNLLDVFDFSQPPRQPLILPGIYEPNTWPLRVKTDQAKPPLQLTDQDRNSSLGKEFAAQINIVAGLAIGLAVGVFGTWLLLRRGHRKI